MNNPIQGLEWDEVLLALLAMILPGLFGRRGAHGGVPGEHAPVAPGFLAHVGSFFTKLIERSGMTYVDENEWGRLVGMLNKPERERIHEFEAQLSPSENRVHRLIVFSDAEAKQVVVELEPAVVKDGKMIKPAKKALITPSSEKHRLEYLRGLAKKIGDIGIEETVRMMRANQFGPGRLQELFRRGAVGVGNAIARALGVATVDEITPALLLAKAGEFLGPIPNPSEPRPNDTAGPVMRAMRRVTPGSFPNAPRPPRVERSRWFVAAVAAITAIFVAALGFYGYVQYTRNAEIERVVNTYQTAPSADRSTGKGG